MDIVKFNKDSKLAKQIDFCVNLIENIIDNDRIVNGLKLPLLADNAAKMRLMAGLAIMASELLERLIGEINEIKSIDDPTAKTHQSVMVSGFYEWVKDISAVGVYTITLYISKEMGSTKEYGEYIQYQFSKVSSGVLLVDIFTEEGNIVSRLMREFDSICATNNTIQRLVLGGSE